MKLKPHQIPHVETLCALLEQRRSAHDGSDTGTGKTYCAAAVAVRLNRRALVVCPLSVVPSWEAVLASAGFTDFRVINWESCWRKLGRKIPFGKGSYFEFTETWPLFIFDEVHRAQQNKTMQGKTLIAATRQVAITGGKILTVSATAADSPMKLGPLGFCLGLHGGSDYLAWLDRHGCPEITMGPKDKPEKQWRQRLFLKSEQQRVITELHDEIYGQRGARMRIVDIPDFPSTQIDIRLIDGHEKQVQRLDAELRVFYTNRKLRAEFSEDELAKVVFLRQAMEVAKVPPLMDMIEDALETSKVAVFANFSATLDAIAAECVKRKWSHGFIRGDQNIHARANTIASFQADQMDVCLANLQAGGVGVSLHSLFKYPRTSLICPTWSAVDLKQCMGRVHRDGGGPSVQHIVYFKGTVEEQVAKSVEAKIDRLELLNDGELVDGVETQVVP